MTTLEYEVVYFSTEDLAKTIGLNFLTGEACAYGMRWLCDLNEEGVKNVTAFFKAAPTQDNWNTWVNDLPAVKSIMIGYETVVDLWIHTMLAKGATVLIFNPRRYRQPACALFNANQETLSHYTTELKAEIKTVLPGTEPAKPATPFPINFGVLTTEETHQGRALCHVTNDEGRQMLQQCFGIDAQYEVLLSQAACRDLYAYVVLRQGQNVVRLKKGTVVPCATLKELNRYQAENSDEIDRIHRQPINPNRNGRHVHQMSGRVE